MRHRTAHGVAHDDVRAAAEVTPHRGRVQPGQCLQIPGHGVPVVDTGVPQLEHVPLTVEAGGEPRVPGPPQVRGEARDADERRTARAGRRAQRQQLVPAGVVGAEGGRTEGGGHQQVHGRDHIARLADLPVEGRQGLTGAGPPRRAPGGREERARSL